MTSITRLAWCCRPASRIASASRISTAYLRRFLPIPTANSRTFADSAEDHGKDKRSKWPFHMTMTSEQKEAKERRIEQMKQEEPPKSLFAKVKYYFKRYWYIAVPAHAVSCTSWFIALYLMVQSGVDVISLLEALHMPELVIEKIKDTPPSAGLAVIALILYKLVIPLRYATTLLLIQASFWGLRRMGKLRTVREVEFKVRSEYEKNKQIYGRRLYRYRNLGVRDIHRKNSAGQEQLRKKTGPPQERD